MNSKQRKELADLVALLGSIRGRHTELVTVMIPSDTNIFPVVRQLEAERSTAENIKSKQTRTAVIDSIESIIRELKNYKQTPKNGLALFAGNISQKEGTQDIKLWAIEPPKPLRVRTYRCDQVFVVEPLQEMLDVDEVYGLVVMDRKEATMGVLEGKQIKVLRHLTSNVPGKYKTGGQCLSPDTLIIEKNKGEIKIKDIEIGDMIEGLDFNTLKTIYNKCKNKWSTKKKGTLLITTDGEYSSSKVESSLDHIFFILDKDQKIKERIAAELKVGDFLVRKEGKTIKIISIDKNISKSELIDIEVENKSFFANSIIVHNSAARFERIRDGMAKDFYRRIAENMKELFFDMPKLKGILVGGPIPTKEDFLKEGELATKLKDLIIATKDIGYTDEHGLEILVESSEEEISQQEMVMEKNLLTRFFEALGKHKEKTVYGYEKTKAALERGAVELLLVSMKVPKEQVAELEPLALASGTEMIIISMDNQDGEQFYNLTKGIGGLLRYQLE